MNLNKRQAIFPLGLVLFALILILYKAYILTTEMGAGGSTFWFLIGLDASYLAILVLPAFLSALSGLKLIRILFWFVLAFLSVVFLS